MSESTPLSSGQKTDSENREPDASQSDNAPTQISSSKPSETENQQADANQHDASPKRAIIGLLLEGIGLFGGIFLLTTLFQESWIVVQTKHWVWLGVSGLSIVGFLLCVSAMFRQRREVAVLGIWLGIIASMGTAVCGTMLLASSLELWGTRPTADMIAATEKLLDEVKAEIEDFTNKSNGAPSPDEAKRIINGRMDAWGMPLRYQSQSLYDYEIISGGPNQTFDDADDLRRTRF